MVVELPAGYHVENFLKLIRYVRRTYADLLLEEEQRYADLFESLSRPAQSLYVRLVTRKGPVFRSDKLNYADIEDLEKAVDELVKTGFAGHDVEDAEVLNLLLKDELMGIFENPVELRGLRKPEILERALADQKLDRSALTFRVLRPLENEVLLRYRLLFFGNLNQDLTEFVLTDMGVLSYEDYKIPRNARMFDARSVLDKTWQLHILRDHIAELIEADDADGMVEAALMCPDPGKNRDISRHRDRLWNRVARQLERYQRFEEALAFYEGSEQPPSRERRTRILAKLDRPESALDLCRQMRDAPIDEFELEFANRFGGQLAKKMSYDWSDKPGLPKYKVVDLMLENPELLKVEEVTRRWFESNGDTCFYVENSLMPGLFGLAFWDIIFYPSQGAFLNPYQRGPLDLFTSGFREERRDLLEARFVELQDSERYISRVRETYAAKRGIANHFIAWNLLDVDLLNLALERIPVGDALQVFRRLVRDLRNNRSGFPDLIRFPTSGGYELVEVKGPGDQLQLNQKRWITAFNDYPVPFRLARISWKND